MEIIKINCEKIKVSLTADDMKYLNISYEMLEADNKEGREAFNSILDEARDQCGFITCGRKIFVQIFPSKDGGCEMYISKLNEPENRYHVAKKKINFCYCFDDIENLLKVCTVLKKLNYSGTNTVYYEREKYYLILDKEFKFLPEFKALKCPTNTEVYLEEHCTNVFPNAVYKFAGLEFD